MATRRSRSRPRKTGSDLGPRVVVALFALPPALAIIVVGGELFALLAVILGLLCLHELYKMLEDALPARLAGFVGLIGLSAAALYGTPYHVLLAAVAVVPILFFLTAAGPAAEGGVIGLAVVLLGVYWVGLGIAHAILLRELPHGDGIIIDVLVGTFIGDSGAYFGGRWFGNRKLAPKISPNKTVEGLVIGILTAILAVWCAGLYQDWLSGTDALLLGLGIALAAPVGDLFESFIKRSVGTKDTGTAFGAHGGALDRLDALLFTLPLAYYVWNALL
jgi:phosphatidate cytidylyltransferase